MMFPSSSYVDPYYSQNKDQVPYPSYPFYSYPVPRPDPSAQPASYAPWPYHFNPAQPNGGTGYSYPPGYYGPRPPFAYEMPPFAYEMPPPNFPNYYHPSFGQMPSYPGKYPQVEHTTHQTHCCGCPNHVCHGTHSPKVKIEEETPDVDLTKMPNNTHPFFWFPPRNMVQQDEIEQPKKERKGAQFPWPIVWMPEDEMKEKEKKNSRNKVERDEIEQPKKERKGAQFPWPIIWMPEDEMKEKEKKNAQFPWPIFWIPEDESKERKDQQANKRASEEATKPSFRIIPLKFLENGDKNQAEVQKPPFIEKKQGAEEARKDQAEQRDKRQAEVKSIPVLEKKESGEKVGKEQPIKEKDGTVTEKKRSKLPPVCLRVDPLPSKRPTNGSSKDKDKKEVKAVDVKSAKDERKGVEVEVKKDTKEKLIPERKNDGAKRGVEGKDSKEREIEGKELNEKSEKGKVKNVKRSLISEQDAALLIQSAYRGYNVRRLDPVNKLKKIRSVHENAQELLKKLQDIEESSKQLEKKEQLVLSESIMNLLLQLDTIQGLHPTVREARKSVARELVSLQEKLDSLEKTKTVQMPTNEVSQPQMEVQPTATNDASDGCKLVSEQVELQASEAPTSQCNAAQEEAEKAHESLNKVEGMVELNLPQSATVQVPVINEEDSCNTTRAESQVTPLVEETRSDNLVAGTVFGENYPEEKLSLPQAENSQSVGSTENVVSHATVEVPSAAVESGATDLAAAVTSSESSAAASHTLSESEMLDTAATSKIAEEIHDTEVAPGVAVTDGIDMAATLPGTEFDGAHEEKGHATEGNAEEAGPEVALSDAITKEVNMPVESHDSYADAKVENIELQTTEDGKPSSKEMKAEDNEIVSDATITASPEVEVKLHATEVPLEGGNANDGVAGEENVALLAPEADKVEDENKSVKEDEVTTLPGTEEYSIPGNEVACLPDTGNASNANDGVASEENVELLAPEADKVKDENKSVEENQVTTLPGTEEYSIPGNEESGLPDTENSEGIQHIVKFDEPKAEVLLPDAMQTDATEVPQPEVAKLSAEEQKLVEENEKLRAMLEKLMEAGRNQLDIISGLNERVKGLEKKLEKKAKKSKVKVKKHKPAMTSPIEVL